MPPMVSPDAIRRREPPKRILAGTDFSASASHAVVRAAMLAAEHSAELRIVHVAPRLSRHAEAGPGAAAERRLDEAGALARAHGVTPALTLMKGDAANLLVKEAARVGAELIVVGDRRKRTLRRTVIGTTAEQFLERWTGDTLVVKNAPLSPYGKILACIALTPVSCCVLMSGLALSAAARLQVLHVYESSFEKKFLIHGADPETIARNQMETEREASRGIAEMLGQCPMPPDRPLEIILRHGNPSDVIPGAARRHGVDLVVVGKNLAVFEEFFLGSVTKSVLRSASSDILVSDSR